MIHNDILRRLRYALALNDKQMLAIFAEVGYEIDQTYLKGILTKEEEDGFILCRDTVLSFFLDGLIISRRGRQPGKEPQPLPAKTILSNNEILKKIRVAMAYKDNDMLDVLALADFRLSKSELSALFRKKGHVNFKACGDQLLRNFLKGLAIRCR